MKDRRLSIAQVSETLQETATADFQAKLNQAWISARTNGHFDVQMKADRRILGRAYSGVLAQDCKR